MSSAQQLGPYRLIERIGRGGMGEVWKARDTRLDREVAVKLSAEQFTDRFEREARAIAALNHPNICTLFDVGPNYLVMELIDGPTLADRIAEGAIPLEESLAIAKQIADALEAAHEKNIVHRDLKPANIKLRPDGSVKVLDFGLAKADNAQTEISPDATTLLHSPTQVGVILGTAAYMAPEQARGKIVDKRADIWSFGVVLHEMLTGRRTFEGEDLTETLASVVKSDPDLTAIPHKVRRLLAKCLQKDPKKRLRDIGDAWDYLDSEEPPTQPAATPKSKLNYLPWLIASLCLSAAVTLFILRSKPQPPGSMSQFTLSAPEDTEFSGPFNTAISPDGSAIVFTALRANQEPQLWLRPIGALNATALAGTDDATNPFWSADGKSIAFFSQGKLKRLDLAGGSPLVLCEASNVTGVGAWNADGVILFGGAEGLHRVPATGGAPAVILKIDASRKEDAITAPQFLPDGNHFLYGLNSSDDNTRGTYAASLDQPRGTLVVRHNRKAIYVRPHGASPGMLVWPRDQTLQAQPFDAATLRLSGEPRRVAENVAVAGEVAGPSAFWLSDAGVLLYRSGEANVRSKLVWMSRDGKRRDEAGPESIYGSVSLSPDNQRAVFTRLEGTESDVWLLDLSHGATTRLTFGPNERAPIWSPDGRFIVYDSERSGVRQLYRKEAAGGGKEELLASGTDSQSARDWSPDGKYILYSRAHSVVLQDIYMIPAEPDASGKRTPSSVVGMRGQTGYVLDGKFSPDGKWLAYVAGTSPSSLQVYVQSFPSNGGKWQISTAEGSRPVWRGDGKELFYTAYSGNRSTIMAVSIRPGPGGIEADTPRALFSVPAFVAAVVRPFDVTSDGQRFLVEERTSSAQVNPLIVVQNWQSGLSQ